MKNPQEEEKLERKQMSKRTATQSHSNYVLILRGNWYATRRCVGQSNIASSKQRRCSLRVEPMEHVGINHIYDELL